ncbi:MAG TPA: YggS family pyridoxal phosphate-dependent enzyme [Dissulfurispiraceae bacterium]|nr:YggS family pyridoxal phosphate-dependent enzyme [Dissulfurispiraceae bacterium]
MNAEVSSEVADNLAAVRERIKAACERAGRDPVGVKLVGVTKTVPIERIRLGIEAGIDILGENYIQEAKRKREILAGFPVSWHCIGHLQTNKAKMAVECCDWIETLDRETLATELNRRAENAGKKVPVLIQVNIGGEDTKSGIRPDELNSFFELAAGFDCLDIRGLMALPPFFDQPERVRPYFRQMRALLDMLKDRSHRPDRLTELSMGMSGDFEVAIEEGATMVRIGTAIFGSRNRR